MPRESWIPSAMWIEGLLNLHLKTRSTPMSEKPISDIRRRMIQDMTVRTIGDKTQANYIRHVEALAKFLGRSPDTATGDDLWSRERSRRG